MIDGRLSDSMLVRQGWLQTKAQGLMLSVPSDRTLIVLESGDLRYVKACELALVKPDKVFKKYWMDNG